MKLIRLAEIYALKYKIAGNPDVLETSLRKKVGMLWNYPNKLFNILKACAEAGVSKAKDAQENKAYAGYKFCVELIKLIDELKNNPKMSLGEMRDKLLSIVNLIALNKDIKLSLKGKPSPTGEGSVVQFPHVAQLIHQMMPLNKKNDIKLRSELQAKARTGLSRILSFSMDMLKDIQELEVMVPERFIESGKQDISQNLPERFVPQRALLSANDIVDFIRQYGPSYGIKSKDDWDLVINDNPELKEEMTDVINALNRGQVAQNDWAVRDEISKIMQTHQEKNRTPNFGIK